MLLANPFTDPVVVDERKDDEYDDYAYDDYADSGDEYDDDDDDYEYDDYAEGVDYYANYSDYNRGGGIVSIVNNSDMNLIIHLKNGIDSQYYYFEHPARASFTYSNSTHIRIHTHGGALVEYRLEGGQSYQISWNSLKHHWDVFSWG